eukprot:CAMPEP_0196661318 /NCGR_PEP_ID=MMETSP1086-20130531/43696_1 /TAXON_ID=77921 /ORGANISM="Cyanoptyche  gloeocystis , Strain SAG4.97" /LENGTH=72 /DNA_ID=CAMNT_0041996151 /DNA_START=27 /DNA_END=245 /DNA_ORIENTATION=+
MAFTQQQDQIKRDIQKYVETHKIRDLFEAMMQQVVINKPPDPLEFLVAFLKDPNSGFAVPSYKPILPAEESE